MLKKTAIFILISFFLTILALWSPWSNINFSLLNFLGLKQEAKYAGLQVYSLQGEIEVIIDDEVVGSVNVDGSPLDIFEITPGPHMVTIRRIDDSNLFYFELHKWLNFIEGINTVIAYELGPSEVYSGGYIIYAEPRAGDNTALNIRTIPDDAVIYINGEEFKDNPILNHSIDLGSDYSILIKRSGYEDIEFNLLPQEEKERLLLNDFDLNVEVNLFAYPIDVKFE